MRIASNRPIAQRRAIDDDSAFAARLSSDGDGLSVVAAPS